MGKMNTGMKILPKKIQHFAKIIFKYNLKFKYK